MRWEIIRNANALPGLRAGWEALLGGVARAPVTLHPRWIEAWWQALGGEGDLLIVAVYEGAELAGVAPLFLQPPRGGALRARELHLLGDVPVGARDLLLAAPGTAGEVVAAVAEALGSETAWDLFDVTLLDGAEDRDGPGAEESLGEALGRALGEGGRAVERSAVHGRPVVALGSFEPPAGWNVHARSLRFAGEGRERALGRIAALVAATARRSGAARLGGPDPGALLRLAERALGTAPGEPQIEPWLLEADGGTTLAALVLLADGDRRIELLRVEAGAGEPNGAPSPVDQLSLAAMRAARDEHARTYEIAALESPLSGARVGGVRLRAYGSSYAGRIQRGYDALVRRASPIGDTAIATRVRKAASTVKDAALTPLDRLQSLREAAPEAMSRAMARVATFTRLHLYRGDLYVHGHAEAPGVEPRLLGLDDFLRLPDRAAFLSRLDLGEPYCRQKWERGDVVVLALLDGLPAGILWCARGPVYVPDIGRQVRPRPGECYIHDVYVAPDARGKAVAPAMLEFLSGELRGRDIYRAWALIERSNSASTRAFQKVRYASVADVIYARMGSASKLLVRPPDREARVLLGLPG